MIIGGSNKSVKTLQDATNKTSIKRECKISPLVMYNASQTPEGNIEFDEFASLALERFSSNYYYQYFVQKAKWRTFNLFLTKCSNYLKMWVPGI